MPNDLLKRFKIMRPSEFLALAAKGETPEGEILIRKAAPVELGAADDETLTVPFIISTAAVDRDRDVIDQGGWDLGNYLKNPVVLWAHDYRSPPIGKSPTIGVQDGALKASPQFTPKEINPFGHMIFRMLKERFINAASVGFAPKEWTYDEERRGVNFKAQELWEFSIVPVGSNPEALQDAKSLGIDITPMRDWAMKILDEWHEDNGIWVPRKVVERVFEIAGGEKVITSGALPPEKEKEQEQDRGKRKTYNGYQEYGFTSSAKGASSPEHIHDYYLYLEVDSEGKMIFRGGWAYAVADHSHRISEESLNRGETESSDGHTHQIPQAEQVQAMLQQLAAEKAPSESKRGRVLSRANEDRIRKAVEFLQEVLAALSEESAKQEDEDGFVIQTLIFPKALWESADAAKQWAEEHEFRTDKIDETEESWRFRQKEPDEFERLRTICINPGADTPMDECKVQAVGGPLKQVEEGIALELVKSAEEEEENEEGILVDPAELTRLIQDGVEQALREARGQLP